MDTEQQENTSNQGNNPNQDNNYVRRRRPKYRRYKKEKPVTEGDARQENMPAQEAPPKPQQNIRQTERKTEEPKPATPQEQPIERTQRFADKNYRRNNRTGEILISVVIPLLNEEQSLPELSKQLDTVLTKLVGSRWEVVFVDDGSTDGSFQAIRTINERKRNFKAIRFRRNYGKSAALQAGFQKAMGKIIITMDADLQDDPAEIPNLIDKLKDGYDLVSGWKKKRHDPFIKKFTSKIFNFFTSVTSGIRLHDFNCGLKAYRRDCAKSLTVYGEMHRYIPALANWDGFRITEIPVKHQARKYGKTKFGASRFIKGYLDLLTVLFTTRYMKRPLHFFGTIGTILSLSGLIINIYLLYEWILGQTYLSNRPLALFGIALIIVGVQLISIGLLGELIVKNYVDKTNVSIKDRIN